AKEAPLLKKIAELGLAMSEEQQKANPDAEKIAALKQQIQQLTQEEYQYMVKNEVWKILSVKGAEDLNAFTTKDVTAYHASMPVPVFPVWADVTSEMVFYPVLREFYQERDVVMEERRLRYDNSPYGFLFENLVQTAFPDGPYHSSPIGFPKDLVGLTMQDAGAFHRRHYIPQNMVGVLVGDITVERAKEVLEKTFGNVKKTSKSLDSGFRRNDKRDFAFQGEVRKIVKFPSEPYLVIAFHKPAAPSRADYVFDLIDGIACEGRTGRMTLKLVKELKMASSVSCSNGFPGSRLDNLFVVYASPIKGHSLEKLEKAILGELDLLARKVAISDLKRVKDQIVYNFFWGLEDNMELAEQLAQAQTVVGDWRYVVTFQKKIESIGAEEVMQTAQKYFQPDNRVVLYLERGNR
ncbi:MAG: pitrilysin family protein, partial [bacterium]|nr:pitrilysin family protein [bacterium]